MSDEPQDQLAWMEKQWKRFRQKGKVRAAKYAELLETLRDDPNCQEIIAREMGWELVPHSEFATGLEYVDDRDDWDEEESEELEEEFIEFLRRKREELLSLPAYWRAYCWGERVHAAVQPFCDSARDMEQDMPFLAVIFGCLVTVSRISKGHLENELEPDDGLHRNIVNCRKALKAARFTLASLKSLVRWQLIPADVISPLVERGEEVRALIAQHLAELRCHDVWR